MRTKMVLFLISILTGAALSVSAIATDTARDPSVAFNPQHEDPTPPRWSDWSSIGGVATSDPASCSRSGFRTIVFVRGTDNALWHRWLSGSTWSAWESLGGYLTSDPAAVSWSAGRIDVFVRGGDNALWHKWFVGGWSAWESLGGQLTSSPDVASWGNGRLDVFARGTDNAIWYRSFR